MLKMKELKQFTVIDIEAFLTGSKELDFPVSSTESYKFIESVLSNQCYRNDPTESAF